MKKKQIMALVTAFCMLLLLLQTPGGALAEEENFFADSSFEGLEVGTYESDANLGVYSVLNHSMYQSNPTDYAGTLSIINAGTEAEGVHAGSKGVKMEGYKGIMQRVAGLDPTTTYTFSIWAKTVGANAWGSLQLREAQTGTYKYFNYASRDTQDGNTEGNWEQFSLNVTTGAEQTICDFVVMKENGGYVMYVDDISVTEAAPVYEAKIEEETRPFASYTTPAGALSTDKAHTGAQSAILAAGAEARFTWVGRYVKAETQYTVSAWVYTESTSSGNVFVNCFGVSYFYHNIVNEKLNVGAWRKITHTFTLASALESNAALIIKNEGSGTIYVDDIAIHETVPNKVNKGRFYDENGLRVTSMSDALFGKPLSVVFDYVDTAAANGETLIYAVYKRSDGFDKLVSITTEPIAVTRQNTATLILPVKTADENYVAKAFVWNNDQQAIVNFAPTLQ